MRFRVSSASFLVLLTIWSSFATSPFGCDAAANIETDALLQKFQQDSTLHTFLHVSKLRRFPLAGLRYAAPCSPASHPIPVTTTVRGAIRPTLGRWALACPDSAHRQYERELQVQTKYSPVTRGLVAAAALMVLSACQESQSQAPGGMPPAAGYSRAHLDFANAGDLPEVLDS